MTRCKRRERKREGQQKMHEEEQQWDGKRSRWAKGEYESCCLLKDESEDSKNLFSHEKFPIAAQEEYIYSCI